MSPCKLNARIPPASASRIALRVGKQKKKRDGSALRPLHIGRLRYGASRAHARTPGGSADARRASGTRDGSADGADVDGADAG